MRGARQDDVVSDLLSGITHAILKKRDLVICA